MRDLDYDVFFEKDGILINTIRDLFDCNKFMYQRRNCFLSFFKKCMTDPDYPTSALSLLRIFRIVQLECIEDLRKFGETTQAWEIHDQQF